MAEEIDFSKWLRYEPETGEFFWLRDVGQAIKAGTRAGTGTRVDCRQKHKMSQRVRINGRAYSLGQIAHVLMGMPRPTRVWCLDGDQSNLCWANLRPTYVDVGKRYKRWRPDSAWMLTHFAYDGETGALTWRRDYKTARTHYRAGTPVKTVRTRGYLQVSLGHGLRVHRLAFLLQGLPIPAGVDHINGVRSDNRWCNLRPSTRQENSRNRAPTAGRSLPKGVYPTHGGNRYEARIGVDGRAKYLGVYDTPEEASAAYQAAAEKHFGDFVRTE